MPTPLERLDPIGTLLMTSTPQATAMSMSPAPSKPWARVSDCWEEPHWLSTVVAGTLIGRPAVSHAVRVTLNDCWPTWLMHPR